MGRPVRGEFTYSVPEALAPKLKVGQRVRVPFGRSMVLGFVLECRQEPPANTTAKLKPIDRLLDDEPTLPAEITALLRFAAAHYRYPLGEAIRGAMPPGLSSDAEEKAAKADVQQFAEVQAGADPNALGRAPAQAAVLSYLIAVGGRAELGELGHAVPGAREALKKLEQRGFVRLVEVELRPGVREGLAQTRHAQLTAGQEAAVASVVSALRQGTFRPFLLHGVTGSGKTEVYLQATEEVLALGKSSLVLVPEIALTPQLVGRFRSRFGPEVAVLHSALKDRERLLYWQRLRRGELRVAVGVRSAIFAPIQSLGLLVVDEEHDSSFKQEEKLRYNARDLAVVRAKQCGATVLLGSATPSLESLENARTGRYELLTLPSRVDDRSLPEVKLVDLRQERPKDAAATEEPPILSKPLLDAIGETLARGQQTILFLNRRGHSTFVVCQVCGESLRCRSCDVCLTHHLHLGKVVCHYCGEAHPLPPSCPNCQGPLLLLGLGTERLEAEVTARFPNARVARLDRDAASSAERLTELLASFARREIDLLVGTQMVAKGHDFPGVTLVCVVMADSSLALPDFRAAERTFQLLAQVAGRAGRGKEPGRVLVQTYNPDSEAVNRVLAHDFTGFAEQELKWRRGFNYPPYTRLTAVRIDGEDAGQTASVARWIGKLMAKALPPASEGVRLLGPAPAPIARIKGKTRWQLLLKGPTHHSLARPLGALEAALSELPSGVRVVIDVDPGTML